MGLIPRWGRSPGGGHGNSFQYSCLEKPMDRGAWRAAVYRSEEHTSELQSPLSVGFSRHKYWSWLPCPPPGDLPNPRIKPESLVTPELQVASLPAEPPGKTQMYVYLYQIESTSRLSKAPSYPSAILGPPPPLPDSSVHAIHQARALEWVSMPSSRRSSQPRD